MKKFVYLALVGLVAVGMPGCGFMSDSDDYDDEYYYDDDDYYYDDDEGYGQSAHRSQPQPYTLRFNRPDDVIWALSNKRFKSEDGTTITFGSASSRTVEMNGRMLATFFDVVDYGYGANGQPYGIVQLQGPYGTSRLFLSESDTDYGGRLKSRVFIMDVNDPNTLYYRR